MRPPEAFITQPIRSLQTMLRVIAESNELQPSVIPDGIYGSNTMGAVSSFQRRRGLPVTGVTDQATWEAIVSEYEPALILVGEAQPIEISFQPNQGMLMVLSQAYGTITPPGMTGILDIPTAQSLMSFQELNLLPMTGDLDRITWYNLARHYPLAARLLTVEKEKRIPSEDNI